MPEKCALSHGSRILGRDPRDSCRFRSPHVEKKCTVTQIRLGEGWGGGILMGGGGPRTENRIYALAFPASTPMVSPPPLPAPGPQPPGRPCSQRSRAQTRGREDDGAGSARRKEQHHNGNEHVTMTLLLTSGSNHTMSL